MKEKDKITTANTISRTSEDWINNQSPIVCAYACVPDWPNKAGDFIDFSQSYQPPRKDIDIEKIQQLINEISALSQKAGKMDALFDLPSHSMSVKYQFNDGTGEKEVFFASANTEIAKSIVELIKGYYELEIDKKKEELKKCIE